MAGENKEMARREILPKSTIDALLNTRPEELISANREAEVIKGNANRSGCWITSPGKVEFFAAADRRLTRVAEWDTINVRQVEKVHAHLVPNSKLVIIKAARESDLTAIPVSRYGSSAMFNLITLLAEHNLTVQTGYKERYDVAYVPRESPLWPALVIDLDDPQERRILPKRAAPVKPESTATTE